ncbi:MAG: YtxH domain-containing protein [Agriterribacter sp.]
MKKIIIAFLSGVTLALLFAPEKGSTTRRKLRARLTDFSDELDEIAEKLPFEKETVASPAPSDL